MLSKLAVRRLTKLADYMEKLPKEAKKHFDMGSWFRHEGEHELKVDRRDGLKKKHLYDCGSTACALGWASTMPYFRKLGLTMKIHDGDPGGELYFDGYPVQWDRMSWLDLSQYQAEHLFGGKVPARTPKQWAKLCRKFLRENA